MTIPVVTEIAIPLEPVVRDDFAGAAAGADQAPPVDRSSRHFRSPAIGE